MPGPTPAAALPAPVVPALHLHTDHDDPSKLLRYLLDGPTVAVTGSRAATAYGEQVAQDLGAELAKAMVTVITGGSYGIEGAVLRGVLATGGRAIVALPSGLRQQHPAAHHPLFDRVCQRGIVLSTWADETVPSRSQFVSRSHLMTAMAGALVVVESSLRGTAMQVAELGAGAGKPVFAVPGPVTSATSTGTNHLIKTGVARLLTCADDVSGLDLSGLYPVVNTDAADYQLPNAQ